MTIPVWVLVAASLTTGVAVPIWVAPWLRRRGVIDVPSRRSSHSFPVVRGGGIGVWIAVAVPLALAWTFLPKPSETWLIVGVATASAVLGWLEDSVGLPISIRASGQVVIGLTAAAIMFFSFDFSLWLVFIGALFLVIYTNLANFMDGVDAQSSLHGLVVGIVYALIGTQREMGWLILSGLILSAAFVSFLPWNLWGKKIFLGDVGSYLLGGYIAVVGVLAVGSGAPVLAVFAPLAIYIADTSVTLLSRIISGERWLESHRRHFYHRLEDAGLSHVQVAGVVTIASAVAGSLGLITLRTTAGGVVVATCAITAVAVTYLSIPTLIRLRSQQRMSRGATI